MKQIRRLTALLLTLCVLFTLAAPAFAASSVQSEMKDSAEYMLSAVKSPEVGSIGGEWAVIGLARSGCSVPANYFESYYARVEKYVKDCKGVLHERKYTEYSRVILALTALGEDATKFTGSNGTVYNLVEPLFEKNGSTYRVSEQGNNGTAFALIALDSGNYYDNATGTTARNAWINSLLDAQISGGSWGIDADFPGSNVDMTAMVVQALAPYCSTNANVKDAVDKAVKWLSAEYQKTGDYDSSESAAQVIVALSALNIDADTDSRFVKNGHSALENLLTFEQADGSFLHTLPGSDKDNNQMSSEQGTYALVAIASKPAKTVCTT